MLVSKYISFSILKPVVPKGGVGTVMEVPHHNGSTGTLPVLPLQPLSGGWQEQAAGECWVDVLCDKPWSHIWAAAQPHETGLGQGVSAKRCQL